MEDVVAILEAEKQAAEIVMKARKQAQEDLDEVKKTITIEKQSSQQRISQGVEKYLQDQRVVANKQAEAIIRKGQKESLKIEKMAGRKQAISLILEKLRK
jgi:vacuolar-type H+-ATPase subunit H